MSRWSARLYDRLMGMIGASKLQKMREKVIGEARGKVLEIGAGTGINFPLYEDGRVSSVHAIEPDPHHLELAKNKRQEAKVAVELYKAMAEELPFNDGEFDTIVCMLVFCTIGDPHAALVEIERVAKSGATILFLEHVKVERPVVGGVQNLLNPLWKRIAGGCHLNRNTEKLIADSSLELLEVGHFYRDVFTVIECRMV